MSQPIYACFTADVKDGIKERFRYYWKHPGAKREIWIVKSDGLKFMFDYIDVIETVSDIFDEPDTRIELW
jgi:hypothetical protein